MDGKIEFTQIAANIKKLRISNHLTQVQMSEKLGFSLRQYRRLETQGTDRISVINWIADSFSVPAMSIL